MMNGSYSLPDLSHDSIFLHPQSRFITRFNPFLDVNNISNKHSSSTNNNNSHSNANNSLLSSYSSLQIPQSGAKDGMLTYKKLGVMACDGVSCGSVVCRGLWKCWSYRDMIWHYKYFVFHAIKKDSNRNKNRRRRKCHQNNLDLARNSLESINNKYSADEENERERNVSQALITMIESVVALASDKFLIRLFDIMSVTQQWQQQQTLQALKNIKNEQNIEQVAEIIKNNNTTDEKSDENERRISINSDLYAIQSSLVLFSVPFKDSSSDFDSETKNEIKFGQILLLFSEIVRHEFRLKDTEYPIIRKGKKWQTPMVYGVVLGMVNAKLHINCEKYHEILSDKYRNIVGILPSSWPKKLPAKKRNLRREIFTIGLYFVCLYQTNIICIS